MAQLPVERLPSAESGRNIAFVDPLILKQDGIADGSVVELTTQRARRLLARVAARPQDEGRGCVRLDRFQIQFLKPDLREKITFNTVKIDEAKRLVLEPMAPLTGSEGVAASEKVRVALPLVPVPASDMRRTF